MNSGESKIMFPGNGNDLKVLNHHIYEYRKGVRNLVLYTIPMSLKKWAVSRLERDSISYIVRPVSSRKVNLFFGKKECVEVVASIGNKKLNEFTLEEDFILGIMLGYGRLAQCCRYLRRRDLSSSPPAVG